MSNNLSQITQLENDTAELLNNIKNDINTSLNETTIKKRGRKLGKKQSKYNYSIEFYDIFQKQFVSLFEGFTFEDIKEQLETNYNLHYSVHQLKNIYTNKNDKFITINHL